jgi:hypothetical protein
MEDLQATLMSLPHLSLGIVDPESRVSWDAETLRALKKGKYVVVWDQQGALKARTGTDIITAYEQQAAESGGFVLFADGRVEWMSAEELERNMRREKH